MRPSFDFSVPQLTKPGVRWLLAGIVVIGWLLLFYAVFQSVNELVFDERMHLDLVTQLHKDRDLIQMLDADSPSATGPLHTGLHALAFPLTRLEAHSARYLNLLWSFAAVWLSYRSLVSWLQSHLFSIELLLATQALFLCSTAFWVSSGLALTEVPTLFCVAASLFLHPMTRKNPSLSHATETTLCGVSGLLLSFALCGRPLILPVLPCVLLAMYFSNFRWSSIITFCLSAVILPTCLYGYWGGFSRPSTQVFMEGPIRWEYLAFSFSYVMYVGLILCPSQMFPWKKKTVLLFLGCCGIGAFSGASYIPSQTFVNLLGLASYEATISRWMGAILVGIGMYTALRMLSSTWELRTKPLLLFMMLAAFLLACVPLANKLMFSTRYFVALLPFVAIFYFPRLKIGYLFCLRVALGIGISYLCLKGYYQVYD